MLVHGFQNDQPRLNSSGRDVPEATFAVLSSRVYELSETEIFDCTACTDAKLNSVDENDEPTGANADPVAFGTAWKSGRFGFRLGSMLSCDVDRRRSGEYSNESSLEITLRDSVEIACTELTSRATVHAGEATANTLSYEFERRRFGVDAGEASDEVVTDFCSCAGVE